ncbi:unnamed protein product [Arabidopsis thaliana]|uniref:(thale cress) hypothetical protein n=1 Tax=Arabidopsis thaliana TaxID=3702 RepID=A0A7G2FAT5_ARATH|nr:unnamed protein product [Arabidopsis thaliana]
MYSFERHDWSFWGVRRLQHSYFQKFLREDSDIHNLAPKGGASRIGIAMAKNGDQTSTLDEIKKMMNDQQQCTISELLKMMMRSVATLSLQPLPQVAPKSRQLIILMPTELTTPGTLRTSRSRGRLEFYDPIHPNPLSFSNYCKGSGPKV